MKQKILVVFGTRPEAIKMAPVVMRLRQEAQFEVSVCLTGQHREMLDQVLTLFAIRPDYDLNVMQAGQDLYDLTARILLGMRSVLTAARPDLVLVHGDTATSTAAALAAFYQKIPVGHVEAGLRTYDMHSPWPEEMNRQLTSKLASLHFAPTPEARENLLAEKINADRIIVTGNTVIDALRLAADKTATDPAVRRALHEQVAASGYELIRAGGEKRLVLITAHRRENFGAGFLRIGEAIRTLADQYPAVDFVYPVHPNPNVQEPIRRLLGKVPHENVFLLGPLDYFPFVSLMQKAAIVLTDSGGIQEEAPSLGKPVLVMRDTTERPEAVAAGTVKLVGTDPARIVQSVQTLLESPAAYAEMASATNPYGDGRAADRIADYLVRYLPDLPS